MLYLLKEWLSETEIQMQKDIIKYTKAFDTVQHKNYFLLFGKLDLFGKEI